MENETLTPLATAAWILLYTAATLAGIYFGLRLFRRNRRPLARWAAGLLVALCAAWLLLTVAALVYPHENHDTEWVAGRPELNYPIDIAVGVGVLICAGAVGWRAARGGSRPTSGD